MNIYRYAALALITLASCNKTEVIEQNQSTDNDVVKFGIGTITRVIDSSWETGDEIGVFMDQSNSQFLGALGNNVLYKIGNSGTATTTLSSSTPIYYPQSGTVDIYAYYPYKEDYKSVVDVRDQSDLSEIDFMVAHIDALPKSKDAVNLKFEHKLARLNFKIKGSGAITNSQLRGLTTTLHGLASSATYDAKSKTLTKITSPSVPIVIKTAADGLSAEALIIPQLVYTTCAFLVPSYGSFNFGVGYVTYKSGYTYDYEITLYHPTTRSNTGEVANSVNIKLVKVYPTN